MKLKIEGVIQYKKHTYSKGGYYAFHTADLSEYGYFTVQPHTIEVDMPDDFDPRPDLIKGLQAQQKKARADFEKLCTDIQRQISELQALEHSA